MKSKIVTFFSMVLLGFLSCQCTPKYSLSDNLGICGVYNNADYFKESGANYLEIGVSSVLCPHLPDSVWLANYNSLKDGALPTPCANKLFPGDYKLTGPDADLQKNLNYVEVAMQRGRMLGVEIFVLGSGGPRRIPEGFSREEAKAQFIELCKGIGDLGEKYGITVVIEPLRRQESNFINSVREGMEIVNAVNKPHLQVLADFYHMANVDEGPDAIIEAGKHICHCHIGEKAHRTAPGVEGDDFTPYFEALKIINYKGRMSMECNVEEGKHSQALEEIRRQIALVY